MTETEVAATLTPLVAAAVAPLQAEILNLAERLEVTR